VNNSKLPSAAEWWQSIRWVLFVFTFMVGLTLAGSFISYQRVLTTGHPWLPAHHCPGCLFCGMTRSFCAMSNGSWEQAWQWNKGGPALYTFFWLWLLAAFVYATRRFPRRRLYAIALALLSSASCAFRETPLTHLVPLESCAVMTIDWSAVRTGGELRRALKGDEFEAILRRLGIASESVNTLTIFSAMQSRVMSGLLLRGSFDRKHVVAALKEDGWTETTLEGQKIYVHTADYLALPASNTLFVGTREGALAVFHAAEDSSQSIVASEAYKKINSALSAGRQPIKAFLLIPQGTLDMADAALTATSVALSFFNLGGVGQLLRAVNVARGFGFTLDSSRQEKYPVELCVLLRDENSAAMISGSLNAMKAVSELAASDNRELESVRALQQMTVERRREVLTVKMEIPASALFPQWSR
jgi:hypothetical protein